MQIKRIMLMPGVHLTGITTDKFKTSCLSLNLLRPLCKEEASLNALLPDVLLGMFNPSEEFLRIGCSALRIISWHFPVAALCIILGASFQALGNGIYSTITSLCRQMLVLLPAAYLLSLTGEVTNVWLAWPIAEIASLVVTVLLFVRIYRQKIKPMYGSKGSV